MNDVKLPEGYSSRTTPYRHQIEAFERFKDSEYFALIYDMGTGKTKTAIDIATYKFNKGEIDSVLLIAPNNIHTQWINEQFPLHCTTPYAYMVYSAQKRTNKIYGAKLERFLGYDLQGKMKILAVNVEAFQSQTVIPYIAKYVKLNKPFIIVDESSGIKTPTAKRTKNITKLNQYGCRCILTGTPATKSPFNLFSQYDFLKKDFFGCNYHVFQHRYGVLMRALNRDVNRMYTKLIDEKTFNTVKYGIKTLLDEKELAGGARVLDSSDYEMLHVMNSVSESVVKFIETADEFTTYRNMDRLRALIEPCTMSVKKEDCSFDLPPKIYAKLPVTMSPEQKKIYNNLKEELKAEYMGDTLTVANKLTMTTRLMQVVGGFFHYIDDREEKQFRNIGKNMKLEALVRDLEEVDFSRTKVIVWCAYVPEIELVYKELSKLYNCCVYYGAVSTEKREVIKQEFQEGKYDIFIGNTQTAGYGLNLQNATLQYFFSNTFRVEARLQAEDRSHRIGVQQTCVYKDIVMQGTIDTKVTASIKAGRELNEFFKDMSFIEDTEEDEEEL